MNRDGFEVNRELGLYHQIIQNHQMKNLLTLVTLVSLLLSNKTLAQQGSIEIQEKDRAFWDEKFAVVYPDFEDNIQGKISANGKKAILSKTSENVDFRAFDVNENADYIAGVFEILEGLDVINDNIEVLHSFGKESFYSSFEHCGCTDVPKRIIELYQANWKSLDQKIKNIPLNTSAITTEDTRKINTLVQLIIEKKDLISGDDIMKKVDFEDHLDIQSYLLEDVLPKNADSISELKKMVKTLKITLTSYTTFVKIYN